MTRSELAEIRRDLRDMRWYIDDAELRDAVNEWLDESYDESDADTAREFVEAALTRMLSRHPMYHAPGLNRPEDGFPDECQGCQHATGACPVLLDDTEVRWRERALAEAETEEEARRIYQRQAIDVDCHRIPDLLEAWETDHAAFIRRGQSLLARVEDALQADGETTTEEAST